jgi:hypothetical protein
MHPAACRGCKVKYFRYPQPCRKLYIHRM